MPTTIGIRIYEVLVRVTGELEPPEENMAGQLATILDYITSQVQTELGHTRVYDRSRLFTSEVDLRTAFLDTLNNRLHFWTVRRMSSAEAHEVNTAVRRTHTIVLTGRVAVNDSNDTEGLIQQEAETICDMLRTHVTLGENCELFRLTNTSVQDTTFAGIGVHEVQLTCTAREYLSFTPV